MGHRKRSNPFYPLVPALTGVTAEKHDSFISPVGDGNVIMEFSGKELVRGEPDASSFPSGGIRSTFEARGYTAWTLLPMHLLKTTPCAFRQHSAHTAEKHLTKRPASSFHGSNRQTSQENFKDFRNDNVKRVAATVGPEQEFFLIDKELYQKRPDLIYCGRTLFGARPPKGQELEDHYFASIKQEFPPL